MTAIALMRGQLSWFRERGYQVTLVCSPGAGLEEAAAREGVRLETIPMARELAPLADLVSLLRLWRLFRRLRPSAVEAGTPKAGLLATLAARLARVPTRVYRVRGLRLETARGWRRVLLLWTERVAASSAHRVWCVSESLRDRYLELDLCPREKIRVVGAGSSNGVDWRRFQEAAAQERSTGRARSRLGIPATARVLGFVGRLTRDKGIETLHQVLGLVRREHPESHLLVLGDFEPGDAVPDQVTSALRTDPAVHLLGWVPDPAPYYGVIEILILPSHREGLPNAPLEAGAAGVPTVGFDVTGTVDAIEDGVTGRLVPVGNAEALAGAVTAYLKDPQLLLRHGAAASERCRALFAQEKLWEALETDLRGLMTARDVTA